MRPEQPPALNGQDYETIARYLDEAIAVYDRKKGTLNFVELRTKSILGAVRTELRERARESGKR